MLKVFTICLAFVLSTPFVASAAVDGEEVETVTVGTTPLPKTLFIAVEDNVLGESYDETRHRYVADVLVPYLVTVDADDAVTVLTRFNGASKLLDCTDADTANTVARVLAQGLTWLITNRDVEAGSEGDLLTAAVSKSQEWDEGEIVDQLAQFLDNPQPAAEEASEKESENDQALTSSSDADIYASSDDEVSGLARQMSKAYVDGEEEGQASGEEGLFFADIA